MNRTGYLQIATVGWVAMVAQAVWFRYASQMLGLSALTVAAVVAMALTGLAIGNGWGSKYSRRSPGWYVAAIGIAMLLAQGLLYLLPAVETWLGGSAFAWSLVVASPLLVINFFAGVVFPRLLSNQTEASTVARLSALETTGGCIGAMSAGCFAIQTIGLMPTFVGAGIFALAVGFLTHRVDDRGDVTQSDRQSDGQNDEKFDEHSDGQNDAEKSNTTVAWRILAAVCVSGIASLGLEIVWQRLLILIVGTDSYSYAIVVTSYLAGIAVGAAVSDFWLQKRPDVSNEKRLNVVASLQLWGAVAAMLTLAGIIYLASGRGQAWANETLLGFELPLLKRFLLCTALLVIPAAIQGAIFPLVVSAVANRSDALASPAGKIYGVLAVGNVIGILLCGFFLIPAIGLQYSVLVLVVIALAAALFYVQCKLPAAAITATVVLATLCGHRYLQDDAIGLAIDAEQTERLFYREGPANTVSVLAEKSNPDFRRLTVDGIIVGQSGKNAEEKQLMLAHLGALLNDPADPVRRVAVIGLGSGLLTGEVAAIDSVTSVTTAELSPAVIQASAFFADLLPPAKQTTSQTIQTDGIHWLKTLTSTGQRFDAIISDGKSRPGHLGNAAFFSTDYYRSANDCLTDSGKFVQWYSLDAAVAETKVVLKTFATSFPHAAVAIAAPDSIYLIGAKQPIITQPDNVQQYLSKKRSQSLKPYHWNSADDLRSMGWVRLNPEGDFLIDQAINSRNRPILERFSYDVRIETLIKNKLENLAWLKSLINANDVDLGLFSNDPIAKDQRQMAASQIIDAFMIVLKRERGWLDAAAETLTPVLTVLPKLHRGALLSNSYLVAAEIAANSLNREQEIAMLIKAGEMCPSDGAMQLKIGNRILQLGNAESALPHFLNATEDTATQFLGNKGAAVALIKMQKPDSAARYFRKAIQSPAVRSDANFMALQSRFKTPKSDVGNQAQSSAAPALDSPTTEQEMIDRLEQLLQDPAP